MNWGEIRDYVRDITHRADLSNDLLNGFGEVVTARINRDLKAQRMVGRKTVNITGNPILIGNEVGEILQITAPKTNGQGRLKLNAVSREEFQRQLNTGQNATRSYVIFGGSLEVAPSVAEIEITHRTLMDALSTSEGLGSANTVSIFYPYVYIYGLLREVYMYLRDFEAMTAAQETYNSEVALLNSDASYVEAGDAPQINAGQAR